MTRFTPHLSAACLSRWWRGRELLVVVVDVRADGHRSLEARAAVAHLRERLVQRRERGAKRREQAPEGRIDARETRGRVALHRERLQHTLRRMQHLPLEAHQTALIDLYSTRRLGVH